MRNKQARWRPLVFVAALALVLAACDGGGGADTTEGSDTTEAPATTGAPETTEAPATTEAPTDTTAAPSGEAIRLFVQWWLRGPAGRSTTLVGCAVIAV